jgi:hypothetical protein
MQERPCREEGLTRHTDWGRGGDYFRQRDQQEQRRGVLKWCGQFGKVQMLLENEVEEARRENLEGLLWHAEAFIL